MPGPLISQFISGAVEAVDELDLAVGKHWPVELSSCNLQMIAGVTSGVPGLFFLSTESKGLMASFYIKSE